MHSCSISIFNLPNFGASAGALIIESASNATYKDPNVTDIAMLIFLYFIKLLFYHVFLLFLCIQAKIVLPGYAYCCFRLRLHCQCDPSWQYKICAAEKLLCCKRDEAHITIKRRQSGPVTGA